MRFSNKQIFTGDTKDLIVDKINENFSQIISFSAGPQGRSGIIGPTGYPGGAGQLGATGVSGQRSSSWTLSVIPPSNPNQYDQWIDQGITGNGNIYQYDGSSWQSTGISLIESQFFKVKNDIPTFSAPTEYSAIYFTDPNQDTKSLVISDGENTASYINPNYSKLLVSTNDQVATPIFSFRKSNSSSTTQPSFYWDQIGNNSRINFNSNYDLSVLSNNGSLLIYPQYSGYANMSAQRAYFNAYNNINMSSVTFSSTGSIQIQTNNYQLTSSQLNASMETYVYGAINIEPSSSAASRKEGVVISRGATSSNAVARFYTTTFQSETENPSFNPWRQVFSIEQSTAILDEVDPLTDVAYRDVRSRAVFGATGDGYASYNIWTSGIPTGPTGPFSYHVVGNTQVAPQSGTFYISSIISPANLRYFVDLSPVTNFYTDTVTFTLPSTWLGGNIVYAKIPGTVTTPQQPEGYPLYGSSYVNEFRILLDYGRFTNSGRKIYGVVWDQLTTASGSTQPIYQQQFLTFGTPCYFFDIIYHYNNSNQVMAYVKTCSGQSYPLRITNFTSKLTVSSSEPAAAFITFP
jgi:hypothetical protein